MSVYYDIRNGEKIWRYRARVKVRTVAHPQGKSERISGTPKINTKEAAKAAEIEHINRVQHPELYKVAELAAAAVVKAKDEELGPTLGEGVAVHVANQRKAKIAHADTYEYECNKYLAKYLTLPYSQLTDEVLTEIYEGIKKRAKDQKNRNPNNPKGAPMANRIIGYIGTSWESMNAKLRGKLGSWNPTSAFVTDKIDPSGVRLYDLREYAERLKQMSNPIKRDGLLFALYTGLRHNDVLTVRFDQIDDPEYACDVAHTLAIPNPKGGAERAFGIPLSSHAYEILQRRKKNNVRDLGLGDIGKAGPWAFPSSYRGREIKPVEDLRQYRTGGRFPPEDVHTLRRTWISVAEESRISKIDQQVLTNHRFSDADVHSIYIRQHIDHLAECAEIVDEGITARINGTWKAKTKGKAKRA